MMRAILILGVPIVALLIGAALFDRRMRRRGGSIGHDMGAAARRARGAAEGKGGTYGGGGDNGGMASG
jgi:hypothetical protein